MSVATVCTRCESPLEQGDLRCAICAEPVPFAHEARAVVEAVAHTSPYPGLRDYAGTVAGRIRSVPDLDEVGLAARLQNALLSSNPETRSRAQRTCDALATAPFHLGRVELVRLGTGVRPCFGPRLLRARTFGHAATSALNLAITVLLDQPDLLMTVGAGAHLPEDAVLDWLREAADGEQAVLEQVLLARGGPPEAGA